VKRLLVPGLTLLAAAGVGLFAWSQLGRITASSVFLVITTAVLGWVIWVLVRAALALTKEPAAVENARASGRRKKELEREKAALLKALKELEFDHQMGKVSDADFREIGGQYRARAVRVMRQLDVAGGEADYRSLVERDVKTRTGAKPAEPAPRSKPKCAGCATENDVDAEFCKKCGKKLEQAA